MRTRTIAAALLIPILWAPAAVAARQTRREAEGAARFLASILDQFAQGDYATFDSRLHDALGPGSSLASFAEFIERDSGGWIAIGSAQERDRRRLVVASAALEAANLGGFRDWQSARRLLDWACALVRKNSRRLDAERTWHRAAIALMEGADDESSLDAHVDHALARFPEDHQFVLARAMASELHTWPDLRDGRTPHQRNAVVSDLASKHLLEAMKFDDTRAEAAIRLGYLSLRNGDRAGAVRQLQDVADTTPDAFLRHLARLFEGRALEQMGRLDDAIAAYRAAIAATPGQTAELALAAALFKRGQAADAVKAAEGSARRSFNRPDPWMLYGKGDARHWAAISEELRRELR
jgi:tetratricopeptide repeat protein